MKILLAHPGTQHAPRLAHELDQRELLGAYWTGLAFSEKSFAACVAQRLQSWPRFSGLATRIVPGVTPTRLHTLPFGELSALRRLRAGGQNTEFTLHERNQCFQEKIPTRAFLEQDAVIGFDTSSWLLAQRAQHFNQPFILDRTIAHPAAFARIMATFNQQYPEWAVPVADRPPQLIEAEAQEHSLASLIVVGGSFARDTLIAEGIDPQKIRINPYGVNWADFSKPVQPTNYTRPFRFLYVGSVIARKGISILLDAWRKLAIPGAELWVAGRVGPREQALLPTLSGLKFLGQVPRSQIPRLYAEADVFVLPSLFEGFGLVLLEALASGLPIIATPHTGAVELLQDPALGELVTAGSVDSLVSAMQRWHTTAGAHRSSVINARDKLIKEFSWAAYGDRWATLLQQIR